MTNLAPTQKDIDSMKQMRGIMDGNLPDVPVKSASTPDDGGMKKILEAWYGTGGDKLVDPDYVSNPENLTEAVNYNENKHTTSNKNSSKYSVSMSLVESSGTKRKKYSVIDQDSNIVLESLNFNASAEAISKYLSKGMILESNKVQTVIGLEEDYDRFKQEAFTNKNHYNRCLELEENEAASVFNKRYIQSRAEAIAVKESIKAINDTIR